MVHEVHEAAWLVVPDGDGRRGRNALHARLIEAPGEPDPWRVHVRAWRPTRRAEGAFATADEAWAVLDSIYADTRHLGRWVVSAWSR